MLFVLYFRPVFHYNVGFIFREKLFSSKLYFNVCVDVLVFW